MLKFYGDESFGRNPSGSQGCYVVAGYVTHSKVWKHISDDWSTKLDMTPKVDYFHMCEYIARCHGKREEAAQFRNMSKQEAHKKFDALVSVLEKYGKLLIWIESTITQDMFNCGLSEEWRNIFKSPYSLCVIGIIKGCRDLMDRIGTFKLDFTFDEQVGLDRLIQQSWNPLRRHLPPEYAKFMLKTPDFENDKTCVPLQCADLLAWHVRRDYISPAEDHGTRRPEYIRLRKSALL